MAGENGIHQGHRQRLKELARSNDLEGMSSYQVMELLLCYALPQKDTNELAHRLIDAFGSLADVLEADYEDLLRVPGVGPNTASLLSLIMPLFRRYSREANSRQRVCLQDQKRIIAYVQSFFLGKKTEELYLFCLDSEYGVISHSCISRGTVNMVSFSGRTLAEIGLRHKARYLLLAHNHPGGRMQPSADDYRSTEALCQTMQALSMPIVDHIIVCGEKYLSFREKALLPRL